jgi:hypothetical protein
MKYSDKYLKKAIRHNLNETLKDKADMLYGKIKEMEIEEAFGDDKGMGDNTPFLPKGTRFRKFKSGEKFDDLEDKYGNIGGRTRKREFEDMLKGFEDEIEDEGDDDEDYFLDLEGGDDDDNPDLVSEGRLCEQCGVGKMNEGECNECGYSRLDERVKDLNPKNKFDYVESKGLKGNQRKLDKNKNGKLDPEDFKLLRKSKKGGETKEQWQAAVGRAATAALPYVLPAATEWALNKVDSMFGGESNESEDKGKKFPDLTGDGKVTRKDILKGRGVKLKESIEYRIKDSRGDIIRLTEDDMVDLIENIVNEQKTKMKSLEKPRGMVTYEKAHRESGKENKDYMTSLGKKMKDYLKDGSKGKYEMNPKKFPVGNGELGEMSKKAYEMTDELEDFNYEIGGQNFPVSDGIEFDEKRMDKYFKGDSTTGNAPGGNALESDANERFNKMRKKNTLKKLKDQSYKRVSQPVFDEKFEEVGKLNLKMETIDEKRINILNEEFDRMKDLFSYNRKTQ